MFLVFFFFKQKTAYEMRISDWSSDVCSSDLARFRKARRRLGEMLVRLNRALERTIAPVHHRQQRLILIVVGLCVAAFLIDSEETGELHQIGRASCRERVCQYV